MRGFLFYNICTLNQPKLLEFSEFAIKSCHNCITNSKNQILWKIWVFMKNWRFFRKSGFLNLLCNYDNFLWEILKVQVILVDLRCICYKTKTHANVPKLPLNIGLQKWVIFTLFTLLQLLNPNYLSCLQEFTLTPFIPIHNHQFPTLNMGKIANFQIFTPENPLFFRKTGFLDNPNFFIILARNYINTIHTHPWSPTSNP